MPPDLQSDALPNELKRLTPKKAFGCDSWIFVAFSYTKLFVVMEWVAVASAFLYTLVTYGYATYKAAIDSFPLAMMIPFVVS